MHSLLEKHINEFFRDITSIGGLWSYLILILFAFLMAGQMPAVQLSAALIIIYVIAIIIRLVHFKDRPVHELHTTILERVDASSFPSIHAARATALAHLLSRQLPEATILLTGIAVLVCASRIYLRKHYIVDVAGGVALGIITAVAVVRIF